MDLPSPINSRTLTTIQSKEHHSSSSPHHIQSHSQALVNGVPREISCWFGGKLLGHTQSAGGDSMLTILILPWSSYQGGDSKTNEGTSRTGRTAQDVGLERHNHHHSHSLLIYPTQHKKDTQCPSWLSCWFLVVFSGEGGLRQVQPDVCNPIFGT